MRVKSEIHGIAARAAAACMMLLLAVAVAIVFYRMFPPELEEAAIVPSATYDSAAMATALKPTAVEEQQAEIGSVGSRFMGQPGAYRMEQLIREQYQAAGLEVYEQDNYCAVPNTTERTIQAADGAPLPDVEIYPFMPNGLQPMNSPAGGLTGTLLVLSDDVLKSRKEFASCIGLIDAREDQVPSSFGFLWSRYAQLGLKALIVAHPDGLEQIPWDRVAGGGECIVSALPVNYVRLAATSAIFAHAGRSVTLNVRTEFASTKHTTLVGVMRATANSAERPPALLLSCDYDACSVLPDLAPGTMQAVGPALHLQALKGLLPYREQLHRDVIFVSFGGQAMSHDGKYNLLRVMGPNAGALAEDENPVLRALGGNESASEDAAAVSETGLENEAQTLANDASLALLAEIAKALDSPGMFLEPDATQSAVKALSEKARTLFDEQIDYVMNALILELSEPTLQTKIAFEKLADASIESQEFKAYQEAKSHYERAMSVAGFGLKQIVGTKQDFMEQRQLSARWRGRFSELLSYHERRQGQLVQDRALIDLLGSYNEKVFIHPYFAPASQEETREQLTILAGNNIDNQPKIFDGLYVWAQQKRGLAASELQIEPNVQGRANDNFSHIMGAPGHFILAMGRYAGYAFFAPINYNRGPSYQKYIFPVALPFMSELDSVGHSLHLTGEVVLALAMGSNPGEFKGRTAEIPANSANVSLGGSVLVSNVGQSMVPNFPLSGALIAGARLPNVPIRAGYYDHPLYHADPYGNYALPYHVLGFATHHVSGYAPLAVGYGEDGLIHFMKDEGPSGQRLFKSTGIANWVKEIMESVTIVTFRASPVTLLDLLNPQTMREYSGVEFVDKFGLAALDKTCRFPFSGTQDGIQTTFVSPDETVYIKLLSGTADNEFANETRAFMLNIEDDFVPDPDREIDGAGYLAQDSELISDVAFDVARSMASLNGRRLDLLVHHNMADERTVAYQKKGQELSDASESGELPLADAVRQARESITYSIHNHPVLRESIFEAVLGILWYLGLLVPFVFFFEKLVFGFSDIRKQLTAQAVIFLVAYTLLNILHPAFSMVRSSLMILLGFIIMIISGGVTVLASSKFSENLEELSKRSGKVKGADVKMMSAIGSAVMLGLNNMHRRKVRTGLTCATLVLMTFVMICFTSVQSDLVDKQISLGKANYQGFLVKQERFRGMTTGEVYALNEEYGHVYDICPRTFLIGSIDWESNYENPKIEAVFTSDQGARRAVEFSSILTFNDRDPIRDQLRFIGKKAWFTAEDCIFSDSPAPVIIPDAAAEELGISPADIEAGRATVTIESQVHPVVAIFAAESLDNLRDLDGQDLLPFDIDALETVSLDNVTWQVLADLDAPRLPASHIIIFPIDRDPPSCQGMYSKKIISSIAVSMPGLQFADARERIETYMERSARAVYYGLDGIAYLGKRTREASLAGLLDMLVPLLMTGLVVLNTLKGSVYERREEIYVYNAIGIAPRYVFFMFFAEAVVYSVVGAVLGYLLSQGVGRILTEMELTGGLNMTFTSVTTIYASIAVAASTIFSTIFPARTAMEIASPADDAGWKLPEPKEDVLSFDLPFTFTHRDRIAVLAFFHRYMENHGEGSSGRFFAGPPEMGLADELDALAEQAYVPQIATTIWLKPYDLSVSQRMLISLPTDAATGEFIAHIALVRQSGSSESWLRLNHGFVTQLRKHFLHWRAVSEEDRSEMFTEASELMAQKLLNQEGTAHHG